MAHGKHQRIQVIDSHTGGEPTRVIIEGGPNLGSGPLSERRELFRLEFDRIRSAIVDEPRGLDYGVGALLCQPSDSSSAAGVIFFDRAGYLGMCGHGTIGLVVTLAYMGRLKPGSHRIETPVGVVTAELHRDGHVSFVNVPCYRKAKGVAVAVSGAGLLTGDVAWGGNWFFLAESPGIPLDAANVAELTSLAGHIRAVLNEGEYPEVDHVELVGPATAPGASSRSVVLCPGGAYDRSPCGTGTSAKLACLAADNKLAEGEPWVQESIIGSSFIGRYRRNGSQILPVISGTAFVNGEATLFIDENDPFRWGIR